MNNHKRLNIALFLFASLLLAGTMTATAQRGRARGGGSGIPPRTLAETTPVFGVKRSGRQPALLFNRQGEMSDHTATLFISTGSNWRRVALPSAALSQSSWTYFVRSPDKLRAWAIAEIDVAGPGGTLEIFSTVNAGSTWSHFSLEKMSRFASFDSLHMNRNGRGSLTLNFDQDSANTEGNRRLRPGFYTYTTSNGGRTWSRRPSFSTTQPPAHGETLDGADETYNFSDPPGVERVREIMRELAR